LGSFFFALLVIIIKAIARNGLASTSRARFQIAAKLMQNAAWHTTIVAFRMLQVIRAVTVADTVIILAVDGEAYRSHSRLLLAHPTML